MNRFPAVFPGGSRREQFALRFVAWAAGKKLRQLKELACNVELRCAISFITNVNALVSLAYWQSATRVVTSERMDPDQDDRDTFWKETEAFTSRRPDVLTANSKSGVRRLKRARPVRRGNVELAPNISRFDAIETPPASRFMVLGQLVPRKRVEDILHAFALIVNQLPGWTLWIVGDGPLRAELDLLIRSLDLESQVRMHGHVEDPSVIMREGGVMVMASTYEGTPNAIMEAMAHGMPTVLMPGLPGAVELIASEGLPPAGIIARERSPESLSVELLRIAKDAALRQSLAAAGRSCIALSCWPAVRQSWMGIIAGDSTTSSQVDEHQSTTTDI